MPPAPVRVFLSSAPKDQVYRDELVDHLGVMIRQGLLEVWHDGMSDFFPFKDEQIAEKLEQADIVLLLLSRHLAESDEGQLQMSLALERLKERQAAVVPILVRAYNFAGHPISKLQALPRDGRSLPTNEADRDEPWVKIAEEVRRIAQAVVARRQPPPAGPDVALLPLPYGAPRVRVLFLAANPGLGDASARPAYDPLNLEKEASALERVLRESGRASSFEVKTAWAVRASELVTRLKEFRPHVLHFSGHGEREGLVLLDDDDRPLPVPVKALGKTFELLRGDPNERTRVDVRLALLNACWSAEQARELAANVGCAVGMRQPVADDTAISFSTAFYRRLAEGETIRRAFELTLNGLDLVRLPGSDVPQLFG
jgi:hypothetical protein